ncbi:modifier of mdg4-like isoform X5 [Drosophila eugracilis]|uniref:modifier of mdg4-like isoform X5 n=1 Tax=Drosophila eugracilis TaxID=29029 RepID=UPI0007E74DFC|nr:modifier of mdg4-like isoform X5 [Drosophila eugracilis]
MADDEQFSLCWNNFNTNLSAGFHESLCRGDLVDVSLAAEGQIVKAHRLVLSVCSPFFRKMFTQMPSNSHAIVFLNNVSHSALKDLIQFMYCGEVNVKQDALPAFISTAESLQIKGLTDNDPAPQPPQEPSPPPAAPHVQQQQLSAQRVQRQQPRASARYKIETVDDGLGDDNKGTTQIVIQTTAAPQATIVQQPQQQQATQQIQTQQQLQAGTTTTATLVSTNKRSAQRSSLTSGSSSNSGVKRSKTSTSTNVIDPLDSATETGTTTTTQLVPQQITVQTAVVTATETKLHQQTQQVRQQQQEEAEYIELPMELPTKSEPDYSEDHGDAAGDGEGTYVEDDAYGDMRYDESYFTENEDAGNQTTANTSGGGVTATTSKAVSKQASQNYSDSSFVDTSADQGNTEAQAKFDYQISVDVGEATMQLASASSAGVVNSNSPFFIVSKYGTKQIMLKQHTFNRHICRDDVTYWRCSQFAVLRCRARLKTKLDTLTILNSEHNHEVISKARKYGSLKRQRAEAEAAARAERRQDPLETPATSTPATAT